MRDNRQTAVQAANGVGKTFLAAAIICWWLNCHEEAIVLVTGSNWNAVQKAIFPHIRNFARERAIFPPNTISDIQVRLSDKRFAFGKATNEETGIAGIHSPHLLQVVEETSGLPMSTADAIEGNATGEGTRTLYLGNPLNCDEPFYGLCTANPEVKVIKISAFDHPNVKEGRELMKGAVTRVNIEDAAKKPGCKKTVPNALGAIHLPWLGDDGWYIPDDRFKSRRMAEFPSASPDALISRELLERAATRPHLIIGLPVAGCDVARYGDDQTVIALAYPNGIHSFESYQGKKTTESAGTLIKLYRDGKIQKAIVDDSGVGGGVTDKLEEEKIPCKGVVFNSKSTEHLEEDEPRHFADLVTEMAWRFKNAVETDPEFFIPNDLDFIKEAAERKLLVNGRGQLRLESKSDFKKRLGRSPDKFDAGIMAYWGITFEPYVEEFSFG